MKHLIILLLVTFSLTAFASGDYTYQKDRKFSTVQQLTNQTFVPSSYVEGHEGETDVKPNKIQIHIGDNFVQFKGVDGLNKFGIIDKTKSKNVFNFKLTDVRGTDFAKLKVVTNKQNHIQHLLFYSKKLGKYTFHLPQKTVAQQKKERGYFTSRGKHTIEGYENLLGVQLVPYQQNKDYTDPNVVREKIPVKGAVKIKFEDRKIVFLTKSKTSSNVVKRKRTKIIPVNDKTLPDVAKVMEIKVKKQPKKVKVFLNKDNQIEFIQIKNLRYFLMI